MLQARSSRLLVSMVGGLAAVVSGCGKERPVEAPVIDVAVATLDGSVRPLVVDQGSGFATPSAAGTGDSQRLIGRWAGVGRQDDGQSWDLQVEITSITNGLCGHADYPTVPCRADWICEGERDGAVRVHEHLLDDSALRCIDNGSMTMRIGPDGQIDWRWTGQGQSAQAKLHRM